MSSPPTGPRFAKAPKFSRPQPKPHPEVPVDGQHLEHGEAPERSTSNLAPLITPRPARHAFHATPRFSSTQPSSQAPTPTPPRPRYILPPPGYAAGSEDQAPDLPPPILLSHAFSPHRRKDNARFLPGGWASTVRGWIVDAASAPPSLRTSTPSLAGVLPRRATEIRALIRLVEAVRGMALVWGELLGIDGEKTKNEVRVVLISDEQGEASLARLGAETGGRGAGGRYNSMASLAPGGAVVLREPMWELDVDDVQPREVSGDGNGAQVYSQHTWIVCAGWRVI